MRLEEGWEKIGHAETKEEVDKYESGELMLIMSSGLCWFCKQLALVHFRFVLLQQQRALFESAVCAGWEQGLHCCNNQLLLYTLICPASSVFEHHQ